MRVIYEKCDPKLAQDRKLPYTAYLIQYEVEGKVEHDIAMGVGQVELFDHYYDCLLYTSPSPRDRTRSRMPSSD